MPQVTTQTDGATVDAEWKRDIIEELETNNAEKLEDLEDTPVLATSDF